MPHASSMARCIISRVSRIQVRMQNSFERGLRVQGICSCAEASAACAGALWTFQRLPHEYHSCQNHEVNKVVPFCVGQRLGVSLMIAHQADGTDIAKPSQMWSSASQTEEPGRSHTPGTLELFQLARCLHQEHPRLPQGAGRFQTTSPTGTLCIKEARDSQRPSALLPRASPGGDLPGWGRPRAPRERMPRA